MKLRILVLLSLFCLAMPSSLVQATPGIWSWTKQISTSLKNKVSTVAVTGLELIGIVDQYRDTQIEDQRRVSAIKSLERLKSLHVSLAILLAHNNNTNVCHEILRQIKNISDVSKPVKDANTDLIKLLETSGSDHTAIGQAYSTLYGLINQGLPKKQEVQAPSVLSEFLTDPDTYLSLIF